MTKKELVRVHVIKSLIEDKMTSQDAVEVLSLRERQIKGIKAGVKKDGKVFVIHKNRGHKPKHTIPFTFYTLLSFYKLVKTPCIYLINRREYLCEIKTIFGVVY